MPGDCKERGERKETAQNYSHSAALGEGGKGKQIESDAVVFERKKKRKTRTSLSFYCLARGRKKFEASVSSGTSLGEKRGNEEHARFLDLSQTEKERSRRQHLGAEKERHRVSLLSRSAEGRTTLPRQGGRNSIR